jgi:hypothetical protein
MIRAEDLRRGDVLQSLDPRDNGRRVRVEGVSPGGWVAVRNVATGRAGQLRAPLRRWDFGVSPDRSADA